MQQMDTDRDGRISSRELKDSGDNLMLWLGIIGTLLGGGGTVLGVASTTSAARANRQVDDLYDATHRPFVSSETTESESD